MPGWHFCNFREELRVNAKPGYHICRGWVRSRSKLSRGSNSQKGVRRKEETMSLVTEEIKAKADEIYHGDEICQEKSRQLLREVGLPNGLLPLHDIEECGIVRETGFVWLKQKKSITHKFEKVGRLVSYAPEVTAIAQPNKIKKLTGVKTKELLVWVTLCDIYLDDPPTGKITFQTPAGLYRSFPASAFQIEDPKEAKDVKEATKEVDAAAVAVKEV